MIEHGTVRGFHGYKDVWSPLISEEYSDCKHGEGNENDKYVLAVYRNDLMNKYVVRHMPLNFSKAVCKFLQLSNTIVRCNVTGKHANKVPVNRLKIPVTCTLREPGKIEGSSCVRCTCTNDMKNKCLK